MTRSASDVFIVDNSDADWKVSSYLRDWCPFSRQIDIATGYFEIGALLALGDEWSKVDKIRILMGDEVSKKTRRAFDDGLKKINIALDDSLELEKRRNDFLKGVPAIVEGIRSGRIECRIYRKDKFHAKCYITHGRAAVVGSFALVGSSNFTVPGLAQNIELNVQIRGPEVGLLQDWYESHWQDAEDVTVDILRTVERHIQSRTPFEIWFKDLHEFLRAHELTPDEWDNSSSRVFPLLERSLALNRDDEPESAPGGIDENLRHESLFERLVVQRSRSFVRQSEELQASSGPAILFPDRMPPQVASYKLKTTYGRLLEEVKTAFDRATPLFNLDIYNPLAYWIGPKDDPLYTDFNKARQAQVVALIRVQFLKRFESSSKAFEMSCYRLLKKLFAWVTTNIDEDDTHNSGRLQRWKIRHAKLINFVAAHQLELWEEGENAEPTEDFLTDEELEAADTLDPELYDIDKILDHTFEDLDQLASFLNLVALVEPAKDDKLSALKKLLQSKTLASRKILLFTEFADTARYLEQQLKEAGIERIDGSSSQHRRTDCIRRFAPYYNGRDSATLAAEGKTEIRILIATDILSEGLNLQDACHLINYDIHWNPVRLMQRIGRVDRRMNPAIEARISADHPEAIRGTIHYWNFLPPDELDELLRLYNRVSGKTRTISKTLGVDTGKLLTGEDEFNETRDINKLFDGQQSDVEKLRIEYQTLVRDHPDLAATLDSLPLKLFSGRIHALTPGTRAVFFCFRIPGPDKSLLHGSDGGPRWSETAGYTVWLLLTRDGESASTSPEAIADVIRSFPDTPDTRAWSHEDLSKLRQTAEKQLIRDHLRSLQAPLGVSPVLKCWMELS